MTPEQLKQMQDMQNNMSAEQKQMMMEKMKNMSGADQARITEQLKNSSPEQMASQMNQAKQAMSTLNAKQNYAYEASLKLKVEGNGLVGQKNYSDAVPKYLRAIENLKDDPTAKLVALSTICKQNVALCYNNLAQYSKAVEICSELLTVNDQNVKALYRRALAYKGCKRCIIIFITSITFDISLIDL